MHALTMFARIRCRFQAWLQGCFESFLQSAFEGAKLARMSSGQYCIIRDLGLVKGGKGLRHHEVVVDLTCRGLWLYARKAAAETMKAAIPAGRAVRQDSEAPS